MNASRLFVLCASFCALQACVTASNSGGPPPSDEDAAIANMNLGAGYLRQGRADLAIERLNRALEQNPRLADAHTFVAMAYSQTDSFEEADTHYRRAIQLEPDNAGAANAYAAFLCQQNRWKEAEPYFRRAGDNARYPTPEVPLANAGSCAYTAGDLEKAQEYFRASLAKNPKYPDALRSMMALSYQTENYLQARAFVQRYLDAQPASADVLWMCFNVEERLDNRSGADRCAEQLRLGFPGSPEVQQLHALQQRDGRQ